MGPLFHGATQQNSTRVASEDKPILYVTMGSSGWWPDVSALSHSVFHAYRVIVTGEGSGSIYGPHIEKYDFIEPGAILPRAAAVICHGGNGTIYQARSYGVPVLCRPSMFEQEWNVAAFERAGWCQRIPQKIEPMEFASLVSAAIHKEKIANNIHI